MAKVQEMYVRLMAELESMLEAREGQGLVEYALIIVLVSLVAMVGLTALGGGIDAVFNTINGILGGA